MRAVRDNLGKVYIFGGEAVGSPMPSLLNDMSIFNTIESSWTISFPANAPTPRTLYTATLLPNGVIGYNSIVEISQISLYDTNSSKLSLIEAKLSSQIENRSGHTAVLAPDGKIIIYGGSKTTINIHNAKVVPDLAVLNTVTDLFEWTAPTASGKDSPSLAFHTANLVENFMIVAFGNRTQINAEPLEINPNIYLMDIRNYTWVNVATIQTSIGGGGAAGGGGGDGGGDINNGSDGDASIALKVPIVGPIVVAIIIIVFGFFIYSIYRCRRRNV